MCEDLYIHRTDSSGITGEVISLLAIGILLIKNCIQKD